MIAALAEYDDATTSSIDFRGWNIFRHHYKCCKPVRCGDKNYVSFVCATSIQNLADLTFRIFSSVADAFVEVLLSVDTHSLL